MSWSKSVLLATVMFAAGPVLAGQFEVLGMGGAGGMYTPSFSPDDPDVMLLSCDMSGSYRSTNGGKTWEMIHHLQMNSSLRCRPLFVGSDIYWVKGGRSLCRSRDKGKTWMPVIKRTAPWVNKSIRQLAAAASKLPVLFVGAGDVYSSRDNGRTWKTALTEAGSCGAIVTAGDTAYAAMGPKVFVSTDRGRSFKETSAQPANGNILAMAAGLDGEHTILFAVVRGKGAFRSGDGGNSWEQVLERDDLVDILMASNQTRVAYACSRRQIFKTADSGDYWRSCFKMHGDSPNVELSWVQTEIKWGYSISPLGLGINPANANTVVVSTQGDIYISHDGARSWKPCMNTPIGKKQGDPGYRYKSNGLEVTSVWGFLFDPFDTNRYYIAYTDIGFARSADKGKTWIYSARGCPWANTFYKVVFDPYVKGKMYAANSSRHDIPHWTHINSNIPSHKGGVCVTTNHGIQWQVINKDLPNLPCTYICLDPKSPKGRLTFYTTFFEGGVYKSVDNGKTWTKKSKGLGNPGNLHCLQVEVHPSTGDVFCGITAHRHDMRFPVPGGIWKSTDGAESWTDITAELKLHWPTGFVLHPTNPDVIYLAAATIPNSREGGLYKTSDGGKNWKRLLKDEDFTKVTGVGYVQCQNVFLHPNNADYVYLCSSDGLWFSPNAGKTWKWFKDIPFRSAQSVSFDPENRKMMYVTTFGGGTWKGHYLP
ncbi:MAG: WD40/YVTN/BNR-like repeat-containing protein [Planctomycetota bacterium]